MSDKTCYCYRCKKWFSPYGIANHLASHKRKNESYIVRYTYGNKRSWEPKIEEPEE